MKKNLILTISGFLISLLGNILIDQRAPGVTFESFSIGFARINANQFYQMILVIFIIYYLIQALLSLKNEKRRNTFLYKAKFRFAVGIALGILDLTGTKLKVLPQPFFPGPAEILEPFLSEGPFIFSNTLYSLRLYAVGVILGSLVGIGTGILIGWFDKAYYWISPVLNITGVIPSVAWMPFALTLLPTPFSAASFLIVICCWFPIASLTASGIQSTPKGQYEAAKILGGNTVYQLVHVAIPHAMPQIFTGISTANAYAFTTLVMAEMLGQPGGLGYYINLAKVWSAYYKIFAAIIIMAIVFSAILKAVKALENHVLRWQKGVLR